VTGQLRADDDDAPERCVLCAALAVGPCARCKRPVCGDCCELSEGGVKTFAVCLSCARHGGASLRGAWWTVLWWVAAPVAVLAAIVALVAWLKR
jgi:hypothetical protein